MNKDQKRQIWAAVYRAAVTGDDSEEQFFEELERILANQIASTQERAHAEPQNEKSGLASGNPRETSLKGSNSLDPVGQSETGVALDGAGAVLPPQRQEQCGPIEPIAQALIHPKLKCYECGDDKLADDTDNGNPGWWRCFCGILHQPKEPYRVGQIHPSVKPDQTTQDCHD